MVYIDSLSLPVLTSLLTKLSWHLSNARAVIVAFFKCQHSWHIYQQLAFYSSRTAIVLVHGNMLAYLEDRIGLYTSGCKAEVSSKDEGPKNKPI